MCAHMHLYPVCPCSQLIRRIAVKKICKSGIELHLRAITLMKILTEVTIVACSSSVCVNFVTFANDVYVHFCCEYFIEVLRMSRLVVLSGRWKSFYVRRGIFICVFVRFFLYFSSPSFGRFVEWWHSH